MNCYDNFELNKCEILDEEYEGEGDKQIAKVKFIATSKYNTRRVVLFCSIPESLTPSLCSMNLVTQIDSREKTAFMETSTFERAGKHIREGAWLYKSGDVEPVSVDDDGDDKENQNDEDKKADE